MQRVTMTFDDDLMSDLDRFMAARGYANRSEAIRDLARAGLQRLVEDEGEGAACLAALVYVYDRSTRDLAARLAERESSRHDLTVTTVRAPLDHETSFEMTMLRGPTAEVRAHARSVMAERGVRHGRVVMIPADIDTQSHAHGDAGVIHTHVRVKNG
jgi:CopG family nickel-responsive transcriptional regulator